MRRSNPLVSVIIPTYNRSKMIVEAIESVLAQDWPLMELIIVDDGSTDDTLDMIEKAGSGCESFLMTLRTPRLSSTCVKPRRESRSCSAIIKNASHPDSALSNCLHYIRIDHSGVSRARNVGIREARGDLIAFLDSDDLWLPGKLKRQAEYFNDNPDISICQTEEIWVRRGRRVNPKKIHKKQSGWIFEQCIPRCIVSPSAVMIRKRVFDDIGLFDEEMPACEDYDLWLRAALKYQIVTLPEPLIMKRGGHEDQLSNQWGLDIWRIQALKKVLSNKAVDARLKELIENDIARRRLIVENGARKRRSKTLRRLTTAKPPFEGAL